MIALYSFVIAVAAFLVALNIFGKFWNALVAGVVVFVAALIMFTLELYVLLLISLFAVLIIGWIVTNKRN